MWVAQVKYFFVDWLRDINGEKQKDLKDEGQFWYFIRTNKWSTDERGLSENVVSIEGLFYSFWLSNGED